MPIIVATFCRRTLCFLSVTAAFAGDNPLTGAWKLKSYLREAVSLRRGSDITNEENTPTAISPMQRTVGCTRLSPGTIGTNPHDVVAKIMRSE